MISNRKFVFDKIIYKPHSTRSCLGQSRCQAVFISVNTISVEGIQAVSYVVSSAYFQFVLLKYVLPQIYFTNKSFFYSIFWCGSVNYLLESLTHIWVDEV